MNRSILLIAVLCTLIACDPSQESDFKIINESSSDITVVTYAKDYDGLLVEQESKIAVGYDFYVLLYYDFPSCGGSKAGHFSALDFSYDSIIVSNDVGRLASNTLFDESNWDYFPELVARRECNAVLEITLTDADFE